jgi:hypothetical protein
MAPKTKELLSNKQPPPPGQDGRVDILHLFATNKEADKLNEQQLELLDADDNSRGVYGVSVYLGSAVDKMVLGDVQKIADVNADPQIKKMLARLPIVQELELRVNARVMLRCNLPKEGLVHGHCGFVVEFEKFPVVIFDHKRKHHTSKNLTAKDYLVFIFLQRIRST